MDATCAIQNSIHVFSLVHINMCPGFWVHITQTGEAFFLLLFNRFCFDYKFYITVHRAVFSAERIIAALFRCQRF